MKNVPEWLVVTLVITAMISLLIGIMYLTATADNVPQDVHLGKYTQTTTGINVFVLNKEGRLFFKCRVDNGEGASPRYQEIKVRTDELPLPTEKP